MLELAPGWGRNTARLVNHSKEIHLVDLNQSCIDRCKARFGDYTGPCKLHYYVNDGYSLPEIKDESISFIYSFDSMVHFDRLVVKEYFKEFSRVLWKSIGNPMPFGPGEMTLVVNHRHCP